MIEYGKALYAHTKEVIEITGSKIGKSGPAGVKVSAHRLGITGSPKISAIATLFDLIFKYPGSLSIYEGESSIYMEINGISAIADGSQIRFTEEMPSIKSKFLLIPDVVYELVKGANLEFVNSFESICTIYQKMGDIPEQELMLFCDSYYYGKAKDAGVMPTDTNLTEAEIKASFRSGYYQKAAIMNKNCKKYLTTSAFEISGTKEKKHKSKINKDDFIKDCKEGKYIVPYEWPESMKKFIINSSFLDTFETTPEFEEIVKKIKYRASKILERMDMGLTGAEAIGKDALNIMLLGKPGTGKTTLAYALSAATGMPVCTTAWNKHSDEDEVEGKTKIVEGHPEFVETNALIFHEFGGIDVNEEINLADPSVTMGSLGQKLEYPYIVKKNGYETIVRHPLNVVIATMNVGTNGSNSLNQALANRFKTPYILDDPTRETFINILLKASGKDKEVCEWVYNAYEATTQYLKDPDVNEDEICQNLSIRTCLGAIENMEEGQSPIRALINSIVGAVAVVDVEVARNLQHEKIECLPNPSFNF